jgi:hypothetical protein
MLGFGEHLRMFIGILANTLYVSEIEVIWRSKLMFIQTRWF